MTIKELKPLEGKYGRLVWDPSADRKAYYGTIKHVDSDENIILFKIKGLRVRKIEVNRVTCFEETEMLPEVTEIKGRRVVDLNGVLIYADNKKEFYRY